jgi:hypothetical protein
METCESSYSFVASGVSIAMSSLFECFHLNDIDLRAKAFSALVDTVPPGDRLDGNIIVLETLARIWSYPLGGARPSMRTRRTKDKNVFDIADSGSAEIHAYEDECKEEDRFDVDSTELTKWAPLTGHVDRKGP